MNINNNFLAGKRTILFQGDSITDCGRDRNNPGDLGDGYPAKIAALGEFLFPKRADRGAALRYINRGVSGNRTGDLLERYGNDFVLLKPDLVSILIGINDTWRRYDSNDPTAPELFEKNYKTLLEKLRHDLPAAVIVIIEPFLLGTVPERNLWREDLDPKIHITRDLAMKYADAFIPMDGIFASYAVRGFTEAEMAADGVHPTPAGHRIIAAEWLKALGAL